MTSDTPTQPDSTEKPLPPLKAPRYGEVNGAALGFVAAGLPLGALGLFAFDASVAVVWGAVIAFVLALFDTALTGHFLRRSAEQMEDPKRAAHSGELRVLTVSFMVRLVVLALVTIAIFQRLQGEVDPFAFAGFFMALHFAAIGGWGLFLNRRAQELRSRFRKSDDATETSTTQ